jgi:hypothetical protein
MWADALLSTAEMELIMSDLIRDIDTVTPSATGSAQNKPIPRHDLPAATNNGLAAVQIGDPARALGVAASYLMSKPAFARLPFGHWARVLIGHINHRQRRFR